MQHLCPGWRLISAQLPALAKLSLVLLIMTAVKGVGDWMKKQWGWGVAVDPVTLPCQACIHYPSVSCSVTQGCTLLHLTSTLFTSVRHRSDGVLFSSVERLFVIVFNAFYYTMKISFQVCQFPNNFQGRKCLENIRRFPAEDWEIMY